MVYPRVCGGTHNEDKMMSRDKGLSPRVRGNLERFSTALVFQGSIPACAGEPAWYLVFPARM